MDPQLYKQWHVIKLVPSAVEGLLLTSLIKINIDCYDGENQELSPKIGSLTAQLRKNIHQNFGFNRKIGSRTYRKNEDRYIQ